MPNFFNTSLYRKKYCSKTLYIYIYFKFRIGVRVNCVLPGITETAMVAGVPEKVVDLVLKMTPLKRMAQPEGKEL